MFGQPSFKVVRECLVSVLGEDGLDLLGNETAVGLAVDGHDRRFQHFDTFVKSLETKTLYFYETCK